MPSLRIRRAATALLLGAAALASTAPAAQAADRPDARGQAAIDRLGAHLPAVAAGYGLTGTQLTRMLQADPTLAVDRNGRLFYVDAAAPEPATARSSAPVEEAPPTSDVVFTRHSRPGADKVIYIDYDGHTTTGTTWNTAYSQPTIVSPPYDIDGNPETWSADELNVVDTVFRIVAEDYAPFDVDVTTEAPAADELVKSGAGDTKWGIRVVVTDDTFASCGCGGHAYINSFNASTDTPAFIYNSSLIGVSEAVTHEVGHSLGLSHDGTPSASYYSGHGSGEESWAPLMGASYSRTVTQWSKQEYFDANNNTAAGNYNAGADDLLIITTKNGFGYRVDDHGGTTASATAIAGSALDEVGVIETTADVDVFSFTSAGGRAQLAVAPDPDRPNLNIKAVLKDRSGAIVATSTPTSSLGASFDLSLPAGAFTVSVEGVGAGTPLANPPTGYTEYASLGQYTLTGSLNGAAVTTASSQISAGPDDAEERMSDGAFSNNSQDIELGDDPGSLEDQTEGLLFRDLVIPQGKHVYKAWLEFTVDEADSVATDVVIRAHDTDAPADFAPTIHNISSRPSTTATTAWSIPTWSTPGVVQKSPDISRVVQEIVDRPGWVSGGDMAIIISGTGSRTALSYDGGPAGAARLVVEFGDPPVGVSFPDLYLSFDAATTVGGVNVTDEDIVRWKAKSGAYSLAFDGSDVGLKKAAIDAFAVTADGAYLSFAGPVDVPGVGAVDDSDVVLFTGTLGKTTSGTFSLFLDGSDIGLTENNEDIDALDVLDDDSLLLSFVGKTTVGGVTAKGIDVVRFSPTSTGSTTAGNLAIHTAGSRLGIDAADNVDAIAADGTGLLLSTALAGAVSGPSDVARFDGSTLASWWTGAGHGVAVNVSGIDLA